MSTVDSLQKKDKAGRSGSTRLASYWRHLQPDQRAHAVGFLSFSGVLVALYIKSLISLVIYASGEELHSHILLVPFISVYLVYIQWETLPEKYLYSPGWAMVPFSAGLFLLSAIWNLRLSPHSVSENDYLALIALSFVFFLMAGGCLFLGRKWMAAAAFPVAFLLFIVPLPDAIVEWLETASMLASADAANMFFELTSTPVLRDQMVFQLPGIALEVARECSGIRSSWVLFITSLVASQMFLKSPWRRTILVAFVIPLGVLRNGFRILVIGLLCVEIGPEMINHSIHRRGGPLFFAASLIPLFLLLWWLRRGEIRKKSVPSEVDA